MTAYHSTSISLVSRCCPYALGLHESGVPADRSVYQVGIAAHAILEAVSLCTNEVGRELTEEEVNVSALGVCERLMSSGRSYDGKGEGPMKPEDVFAGKEVALQFLAWNPEAPGGKVEVGIGLDADGQPCDYWRGPNLLIRTILDRVQIVEEVDEESSRTVLRVRDYKTAWSASEADLETLQRRIQAVAAWRVYGPADVLSLEIVNVRLGKVYEKILYREDCLEAQLDAWWLDIAATARALDAQKALGPRPAIPGRGCLACPYLQACPHAQDYMERAGMHRTPEQRATAYCVAAAMRDELGAQLRIDAEERPIPVAGGFVGTTTKVRQVLGPDGYATLADRWTEHKGDLRGFAKAIKMTASNAKEMAKTLYFDRSAKADREALMAEVLVEDRVREFGVWTVDEEGEK